LALSVNAGTGLAMVGAAGTWLPSTHEMSWFTGGWFTGVLTGLLVALIAIHLGKRM